MKRSILSLLTLLALAAAQPSLARAQTPLSDLITQIGEVDEFESDVAVRYINAAQCAEQSDTEIVVRLDESAGPITGQVVVWVGRGDSNCELVNSRTGDAAVCGMVTTESVTTGPSISFSLATLVQASAAGEEIVDCDDQTLQGLPYELLTYRGPSTPNQDLALDEYGLANFTVDVAAPEPVTITSDPELRGSSFTISWERPDEQTAQLEGYQLFQSDESDSTVDEATQVQGATAGREKDNITVSKEQLGLPVNGSTFVFVQTIDLAGNEGELSSSTEVTAVDSGGYCDQEGVECGCSASAVSSGSAQRSLTAFVMLLLMTVLLLRRRFIR